MQSITNMDRRYAKQTAWVVGRGQSLARLSAGDFGPGPVIAINQAIFVVEELRLKNPVFSMQKDKYFGAPKTADVLLHERESLVSAGMFDPERVYYFDAPKDYSLRWDMPSVVVCGAVAFRWGCANVIYLCCDAAWGDTEAYGTPAIYPANYLQHVPLVRQYAPLPVEWKRI